MCVKIFISPIQRVCGRESAQLKTVQSICAIQILKKYYYLKAEKPDIYSTIPKTNLQTFTKRNVKSQVQTKKGDVVDLIVGNWRI